MLSISHAPEKLARLGGDIFDQRVRPTLKPDDNGKFIAIDVTSGEFEIDKDDYAAVMRLRVRKPEADMWLMRDGYPSTCRIAMVR